jgi:hypothetical protein
MVPTLYSYDNLHNRLGIVQPYALGSLYYCNQWHDIRNKSSVYWYKFLYGMQHNRWKLLHEPRLMQNRYYDLGISQVAIRDWLYGIEHR